MDLVEVTLTGVDNPEDYEVNLRAKLLNLKMECSHM